MNGSSPKHYHYAWANYTWLTKPSWFHFIYFLIINLIFSYFTAPNTKFKVALLLFSVLIPVPFIFLARSVPSSVFSSERKALFPRFPKAFFVSAALVAVLLRLFCLTALEKWPTFDEAMLGFFGLDISQGSDFQLWYGIGQTPPTYVWILGLVFKLFHPSLLSLWLPPAIFSILTLPLVFFSCRMFLQPFETGLFTWLWTFSFWPLHISSYGLHQSLFIFWLWLAIYLFCLLYQRPELSSLGTLFCFSVVMGLGFYISLSWPFIYLAATAILAATAKNRRIIFPIYLGVCLLLTFPLLVSLWRREFGGYIYVLWAFQSGYSWGRYFENIFLYLSGIFWGTPAELRISSYGPCWGGFLNPISGSFCMVGILVLIEQRLNQWALAFAGSLLVFLMPVFVTKDLEYHRILQILPLLIGLIALGFLQLASYSTFNRKSLVFVFLLTSSFTLDTCHLFLHFPAEAVGQNASTYKSLSRYKAYETIEKIQKEFGPGMIFDHFQVFHDGFTPRYMDCSLEIATYGFNKIINPALNDQKAQWVAILYEPYLEPLLKKWFPNGIVVPLGDKPAWDSSLRLFIVLRPDPSMDIWKRWIDWEKAYHSVALTTLTRVVNEPKNKIIDELAKLYPMTKDDVFLVNCFWAQFSLLVDRDDVSHITKEHLMDQLTPSDSVVHYLWPNLGRMYYLIGINEFNSGFYNNALKDFLAASSFDPQYLMPRGFEVKLQELTHESHIEKLN